MRDSAFAPLALAAFKRAGGHTPWGVNVVSGGPLNWAELTENPIVRKLSFTGSTEVGKLLMRACAGTVKRISLELGGHAPLSSLTMLIWTWR